MPEPPRHSIFEQLELFYTYKEGSQPSPTSSPISEPPKRPFDRHSRLPSLPSNYRIRERRKPSPSCEATGGKNGEGKRVKKVARLRTGISLKLSSNLRPSTRFEGHSRPDEEQKNWDTHGAALGTAHGSSRRD